MFKFRKIASVLASAIMVSSTVALAAAANYPAPFVTGGNADVAVVYGSAQVGGTDLVAAADIQASLQVELSKQTATSGTVSTGTITGESAPLFTSSTRLYMNDTLNQVKSVLTEAELPTVLKDGSFSGNVDATFTQTIDLGANPQVTYAKQPTSSDDPQAGLTVSTSTATYIYNASVSFNKAVNFSHADSEGQDITLFGQKFTVASATDVTNLVLLKTAEKVSLSSDAPTTEVTISGKKYTVELISASDTAATVKVTDEAGTSETKEISENASKKVGGITIAITNADETNLKLSASVIAGAEKVTMTSGSSVTTGDDAKVIDGTLVTFTGGTTAMTKLVVSVAAKDSDNDAILPGTVLNDPVFGSFKLDFSGINIGDNSTARENIKIYNSGDDKILLSMKDYRGNEKNIQWAINKTTKMELQVDSDGRNITVNEREPTYRGEYIVLGNEDEGRLLKVSTISNQTDGYSQDSVKFTDAFSADVYETTLTAEGTGTVTIGGKVYNVNYFGAQSAAEDSRYVRVNSPDSSGAGAIVLYPTIMTSKGALVAFYEPVNITNLGNWDGASNAASSFEFPDGDGFTSVALTLTGNWTVGGTQLNMSGTGSKTASVGSLTYNITATGNVNGNNTMVYLLAPEGGNLVDPALIIFEEKDDNSAYQAMVVTLEAGASSDDGIGVNDVSRTWGNDAVWDAISLASNSKISKEMDLFGAIATIDSGDSDQKSATISYPDEQVSANVYMGLISSSVSGGTVGSGTVKTLGSVIFADTEATSFASKNIVVVGGSCVNTVAASLIGATGKACGADFTAKTGVNSGEFLIETYSRTGGKFATLVAGYNAADTTNAAKYLTTQAVDTAVGKKYKGTSATSATLQVAATA